MQAARLAGRLQRELRMLQTEPPPGVAAWLPSPLSLSLLHAQIEGPEGSVYAKGIFKLAVQVPDRYPFEPPNVRFVTPIYHPNIDNVGRICLDILNLPPKGVWRPSLNLSTVLASIGLLLAEPNPDDGLMIDITAEYKHHRATFDLKARTWTEKHAMQNLEIGFDGVGWDSLGDVLGEASEPTTSSSKMVGSHSDLATGKQPDNALEGNQEAFHRLDKQLVQLSKGRLSSRMTLNSLGRATENPPLKGSDGLCKGKENLTPDGRCAKDNRVMKGEVPRNEHGECLGRTVTSDESLADNNEEEVVVAMPEHMKEAPINDCRESLHQTITPNNEEEVVVVVPELMKEAPRKKSEESPHQTITPNNEEEVVIVHALMKEAPRNECRESPHQTITPDNEEEAVVVVPELMKEALRKKCKESPRQTITLDDEEEAVELAPKLMKEALRKKCKESPRQTITLDDEEEAVELAPKLMKEAPERNERGNSQRQTVEKCDERVVLAPVGMSWRSTQEKRVVEVNALKEERSIFLSLRSKSLKLSRPKEPKEPVLVDDALVEVSPTVIVSDSGSEEELAEGRYRLSLSQKSSTRKRKGSSKAR